MPSIAAAWRGGILKERRLRVPCFLRTVDHYSALKCTARDESGEFMVRGIAPAGCKRLRREWNGLRSGENIRLSR